MSDSLQPHRLQPTRLLRPWDSPGKSTGVGCHRLLQRTFPTQSHRICRILLASHWSVIVWFGTILKFYIFENNSVNKDQIFPSVRCHSICSECLKTPTYSANYIFSPIPLQSLGQGNYKHEFDLRTWEWEERCHCSHGGIRTGQQPGGEERQGCSLQREQINIRVIWQDYYSCSEGCVCVCVACSINSLPCTLSAPVHWHRQCNQHNIQTLNKSQEYQLRFFFFPNMAFSLFTSWFLNTRC